MRCGTALAVTFSNATCVHIRSASEVYALVKVKRPWKFHRLMKIEPFFMEGCGRQKQLVFCRAEKLVIGARSASRRSKGRQCDQRDGWMERIDGKRLVLLLFSALRPNWDSACSSKGSLCTSTIIQWELYLPSYHFYVITWCRFEVDCMVV